MSDEPPLDVLTVVQLSDPLGGLATPAPQFVTPEKSAPATCTVMVLPAVSAPALDVSKSSTQEDFTPPTVGAAVRVTAATLPPTAPEGGWATTTAAPTVVINTIAAKPGRTQRPPRSCRPPRRQLRVGSRPNRFGAPVNDMPTASSSAFWRPPIGAESPAARQRDGTPPTQIITDGLPFCSFRDGRASSRPAPQCTAGSSSAATPARVHHGRPGAPSDPEID